MIHFLSQKYFEDTAFEHRILFMGFRWNINSPDSS